MSVVFIFPIKLGDCGRRKIKKVKKRARMKGRAGGTSPARISQDDVVSLVKRPGLPVA